MNCIVPGANLKVMGKVLQTLAKIGDELYIEAKKNQLQFTTINMNKTAYSRFNFFDTFFTSYNVDEDDIDIENNPTTCKLLLKSILNIFKSKSPKDKVELCKIQLDIDATKIIFKLKYKHDITIVHSLRLIDMEFVSVTYDEDSLGSKISSTGVFFGQILANFQNGDEDMTFDVKTNKIFVRNYDENSTNIGKHIRSQVSLQGGEFLKYSVMKETVITMGFKAVRAVVSFCDGFNLNVTLSFHSGGKPVILTTKNPTFDATFILSTIDPNGETQSCATSTVSLPKIQKASESDITTQDKAVLDSLNWDSDFDGSGDIVENGKNQLGRDKNDAQSSKNHNINGNVGKTENLNLDEIPRSPESPRSKRIKLVFGRCLENTFRASQLNLGKVLAPDSDPDSEPD